MADKNQLLQQAQSKKAQDNARKDLKNKSLPDPFKGKHIIFNKGGQMNYGQIKQKIAQGYTPLSLSSFKKQTNQFLNTLPGAMGSVVRDKIRLKQQGVDVEKLQERIKSGNPGSMPKWYDDRNFIEKILNLNPHQGFVQDVAEVLDRPTQMLKNSIWSIGEKEGTGQKIGNFFVGAFNGLIGNADEHSWEQSINHGFGTDYKFSQTQEFAMDVMLDPLNMIPAAGALKVAKQEKKFAKGAAIMETKIGHLDELAEQAIRGNDYLHDGKITMDGYNTALNDTIKEAGIKGHAKKKFEEMFRYEKNTPKDLYDTKDGLFGNVNLMEQQEDIFGKTLKNATPEETATAMMHIETRGKFHHDIPTNVILERVVSLKNQSKDNDALMMFGKEMTDADRGQVAKMVGIRNGAKKRLADNIKLREQYAAMERAGAITKDNVQEVKDAMRNVRVQDKKSKAILKETHGIYKSMIKKNIGKEVHNLVDKINSMARTKGLVRKGQDILHIDMASDLKGTRIYTNNEEAIKQLYKDKTFSQKLHEHISKRHGRTSVRIPISKRFVAKWKDLSPKSQEIVKGYDNVRKQRYKFATKHSKVFDKRYEWDRYMLHSHTDEADLLMTVKGQDNYKPLLGSHETRANNAVDEAISSTHEITGAKQQRKAIHSRRIFGTIHETNAFFGDATNKFFNDNLTELVHLSQTDLKRYILPEAFMNEMHSLGHVKGLDANGKVFTMSKSKAGGKEVSKKVFGTMTEDEATYNLRSKPGQEENSLGFSSDVARHLEKSLGTTDVVLNKQSAAILQQLNKVGKSNAMNSLYGKYFNMWKGSKLFSTGFHMRNITGMWQMSYMAGYNPLKVTYQAGKYGMVVNDFRTIQKEIAKGGKLSDLTKSFSPKKIERYLEFSEFQKTGIPGGGYVRTNLEDSMKMMDAAKGKGVFTAGLKKAISANYKLAGNMDDAMRYGIWKEAQANMNNTKRFFGMNANASDAVRGIMFDYSRKTKFEKQLDKVIPFWFFSKNSMILTAKAFLKNPNRISHIMKVMSATHKAAGIDETQLPEYVKEQGYLSIDGMTKMLTGKAGKTDNFLKWGGIVNQALNPAATFMNLSPVLGAAKTMLSGQAGPFQQNWDRVSQKYNSLRAVAGDIGINPQQAISQMRELNNPYAQIGLQAPRFASVLQQLDPTPLASMYKTLNGVLDGGHSVSNWFPSVVKHINPIEMKMQQVYFEKGLIDQVKKSYETLTGHYLPGLFSFNTTKAKMSKDEKWNEYYGDLFDDGDDHRMQQDLEEILHAANA